MVVDKISFILANHKLRLEQSGALAFKVLKYDLFIDGGGDDLSLNTFLISSQQLRSKLGEDVHIPCPTSTTKGEKNLSFPSGTCL